MSRPRRLSKAITRSTEPHTMAFCFNLSRACVRLRECACTRCLDGIDEWLRPRALVDAIEACDGVPWRRRNAAIERILARTTAGGKWVR